jgi:hypothetical protein
MTPTEIDEARRSAVALLNQMLASPEPLQYGVILTEFGEAVSMTRSADVAYAVTLTWLMRGHSVLVLAKPTPLAGGGDRVIHDGAFVNLDPSVVPWWYLCEFVVVYESRRPSK